MSDPFEWQRHECLFIQHIRRSAKTMVREMKKAALEMRWIANEISIYISNGYAMKKLWWLRWRHHSEDTLCIFPLINCFDERPNAKVSSAFPAYRKYGCSLGCINSNKWSVRKEVALLLLPMFLSCSMVGNNRKLYFVHRIFNRGYKKCNGYNTSSSLPITTLVLFSLIFHMYKQ